MVVSSIFLIAIALAAIYFWCRHTFSYWKRKGLPYIEPTPFIGNTKEAFTLKRNFGLHLSDIYNDPQMKKEAVVGIYTFNQPGLVIREPELLKSVLIKDFNYFNNRYGRCDPHGDALGNNNLFFARGNYWKDLRTKISPVFTSGKIKQMYPLMLKICQQLENSLATKSDRFETEIKEICALFTTDLIATIAFGIEPNSQKNPNGEFRTHCRKFFLFNIWRAFDFSVAFFLPKLVRLLRVKFFPADFSAFLRSNINYVMQERERSGNMRNDLIDILVKLKKEAAESKDSTNAFKNNDCLVAQAAVFLTAGFETSSSTMAFTFYEIARQPEIQERLRSEILDALLSENSQGTLSYEKIMNLEYLNMVIDETLRLYPILPFLDRQYATPDNQKEALTLKPFYDYALPDGLPVFLPIFAIQRDEKYWTNPNHFDPERFSAENKIHQHNMAYLPFGTGPHNCIGMRTGLLQTKLGLVHFLKNYYVKVCPSTIKEPVFDPKAFLLQFENGIHLEVIRDNMYDNALRKNK